jgi:hypothetical protein
MSTPACQTHLLPLRDPWRVPTSNSTPRYSMFLCQLIYCHSIRHSWPSQTRSAFYLYHTESLYSIVNAIAEHKAAAPLVFLCFTSIRSWRLSQSPFLLLTIQHSSLYRWAVHSCSNMRATRPFSAPLSSRTLSPPYLSRILRHFPTCLHDVATTHCPRHLLAHFYACLMYTSSPLFPNVLLSCVYCTRRLHCLLMCLYHVFISHNAPAISRRASTRVFFFTSSRPFTNTPLSCVYYTLSPPSPSILLCVSPPLVVPAIY